MPNYAYTVLNGVFHEFYVTPLHGPKNLKMMTDVPFYVSKYIFNTFLISCIYIVYVVHKLSTVCEYKNSYLIINFFPTLYTSTFLTETTKKLGPE